MLNKMSDNMAFDALPKDSGSQLFTESLYNTKANKEEKGAYDRKANRFLRKMYADDKKAGLFDKLDFDQYMGTLSSSYFEERVNLPREDDPLYFEEAGTMFFDIYEGDFDQFKASALGYKEPAPRKSEDLREGGGDQGPY